MPTGKPWLTGAPSLRPMPVGQPLWHVFDQRFGPLSANPRSAARLALVGTHAMFYIADTLAGAMWETVLRNVAPDAGRHVQVRPGTLAGMRAVPLRLLRNDIPLLELGQPGLRALFPIDSPEAAAVAALLHDPEHTNTHAPARELQQDLVAHGHAEMPMLSWPSRQLSTSTVYLAYQPPMTDAWWAVDGPLVELDDPHTGYPRLQAELERWGYSWTPLATQATRPPEE